MERDPEERVNSIHLIFKYTNCFKNKIQQVNVVILANFKLFICGFLPDEVLWGFNILNGCTYNTVLFVF